MGIENLKKAVRDIPDFPKKGIIFKDITPALQSPAFFKECVDLICLKHKDEKIDAVVSIESRGFIFGAAAAYKLGAGFVPVRKKGKLPCRTIEATYELEYGTDTLQMHQDAIEPGQRVLIIDDLLATGGTARAAAKLVERLKGEVAGVTFLIELTFLKGRDRIKEYPVHALIQY